MIKIIVFMKFTSNEILGWIYIVFLVLKECKHVM